MHVNTLFDVTKVCTKCNKELPATPQMFNRMKRCLFGLDSVCKVCRKAWQEEHKKEKKAYDKTRYHGNKDFFLRQSHERYHRNKKTILAKEKQRRNNLEYKQHRIEYRKSRRDRDRLLYREWRRRNMQKISTIKQRRYNLQKGLKSDLTHERWEECKRIFDYKCAYCGRKAELAREHFIPVTKGGSFTVDNIIPSCTSCNSSKNNRNFEEWYSHYEFYSEKRKNKIYRYLHIQGDTQQTAFL